MKLKYFIGLLIIAVLFLNSGCGSSSSSSSSGNNTNTISEDQTGDNDTPSTGDIPTADGITVNDTKTATSSGQHALSLNSGTASYSNLRITKTGSPSDTSDNYDFYGENAAVLASNDATLTLTDSIVSTDAAYANAVFAYNATVNITGCVIITNSRNSGGIMTTGGGTMNATNLNVTTSGNSSAPIRSDRGGGNVFVNGGVYTASGVGSPAIYSTAAITVADAYLTANKSQGVVVEGRNSVTLSSCDVMANHTAINGSQTTRKQAVMVYQSFSGDASEGKGTFSMLDGALTNYVGDIFYITNTTADIGITSVAITNNDTDGVFLRAEAAGWGNSGSNGGKVNLYATTQAIDGDIIVDSSSAANIFLTDGSDLYGAVNNANSGGNVYVEVSDSSIWKLTGDSYITGLTCEADNIDLNGYTLYVNGTAYTSGSSSTGTAISF